MILSLQYSKLSRQGNDYAEEGMGRQKIRATECKYKEIVSQVK